MAPCILITGASGFVGRQTLRPLIASSAEIHCAGRGDAPVELTRGEWHRVDLLDQSARNALIDAVRPDTILHAAWETEHGRFWTAPSNLDWVAATTDLMRKALDRGLRRFIGVGSCFEYGDSAGACDEQTTAVAPRTLYATAKDACRRMLEAFAAQGDLSYAWARLFLLYGPDETPNRLVPSVARRLVAGEPALISSGRAIRDFMDSRDAGAALAALALSDVTGPVNIASGRAATVREVAEMLGRLSGRSELVRPGALADRDEPARLVADVRRLNEEVGFCAARPLEQGLMEALAHWRDQPAAEMAATRLSAETATT